MVHRALGAGVVTALALALSPFAAPASGATTQIGAVAEIQAGTKPNTPPGESFWTVQVSEVSGTYAVPPGYGVITAWSHSAGATAGALTFKVYRPAGGQQMLVVAGDTRTIVTDTVQTFPVRIPVRPGDRIGLSTDSVEIARMTGDPLDQVGTFDFTKPDPPPGTTATLDPLPFTAIKLLVSARVETDADRDGFGDDTQDGCPTSAATRGPCSAARPAYPGPGPLPAFAGCAASASNVIRGTAASESIVGTPRADRIFAGTGNDTVDGLAADDCIDLGPGTDRGQGGDGNDVMLGSLGADRLVGGVGADRLLGGAAGDRLIGGFGDDVLQGQSGADRVNGERGRDRIDAGSSNDVISGGSSGDRIAGGQGNDRLTGNSGNDSVTGNAGRDRIDGSSGRDRLSGGSGADRIDARDGRRDRIACGSGRDTVIADRADRIARDCERVRRRGRV